MSVMSIGKTAYPDRPLTVEDLERMPDDGRRYELADGRLDVSPAPGSLHTIAEYRLVHHLGMVAPSDFLVVGPVGIDFNAEKTHHRIPDGAVFHGKDFEKPRFTKPPLLAIEVLSPESVLRDTNTKRQEYAAFGIESYWMVNPAEENPAVYELRLEGGAYREAAQVFGTDLFSTDAPFPVSLVPYWLIGMDGDWREHIGGPGGEPRQD
ncbi:Uma2 family endonuclease [Nocardiopsis composta]|uniref:Uma2 family endonuclease n=1 Tax=Nocardiopsis composta TaxID=157465 RepID=UPI0016121B23|nr:Uma2 family endonuclease [Nocardiopsis composta]